RTIPSSPHITPPLPLPTLFPYTTLFRSLTRLGLDQFCLEAHSTKAGKTKIMEELKRTLELASRPREDMVDEHLEDLLRIRAELKDRKSTRLNSSHVSISYAVFCLKKKKK